jgi:LCP family protein required for cell wall assembly
MQPPAGAPPRQKSALAAAFLSLLFPGLGHAYAGAWMRALGFAALPILAIALGAGFFVRTDLTDLLGFVAQPGVLTGILVINVLAFLYRAVAAIDAWRLVRHRNAWAAAGGGRLGRPRMRLDPLAVAGLGAVLLVMSTAHVAVARYDLLALDFVNCTFGGSSEGCEDPAEPGGEPEPSSAPTTAIGSPSAIPSPEPSPVGSPVPEVTIPPWDGTERLNILLIGSDQRPNEGTYNTDTLIVVSIDPVTEQVAMFSLPRDAVGVPVPSGAARRVWGSTYESKINSWFTQNRKRSDLWPGNNRQRGYNALKSILGNLYGIDIKYYVEVGFGGFRKVIDTLGGVTVNVQFPVTDDSYPGKLTSRVYIPTGLQHMTGSQALVYARSRHSSNDFDRAARQQRLLLSLRQQIDPSTVIANIEELVTALKSAVKTDIPVAELPKLLGLAERVDLTDVRSYVFAPSFYGREGIENGLYVFRVNADRIRSSVRSAFKANPVEEAEREALSAEGATIWVLNGIGDAVRSGDLAAWMEYRGLNASSPRQRPEDRPKKTALIAYNGAETKYPQTIAFLEKALKTTAVPRTDPSARVDIAVTVATDTPKLTPPRLS